MVCVLCRSDTRESSQCPTAAKRRYSSSEYQTFENNLLAFSKLGKLSKDMDLKRLDEGQCIAVAQVMCVKLQQYQARKGREKKLF